MTNAVDALPLADAVVGCPGYRKHEGNCGRIDMHGQGLCHRCYLTWYYHNADGAKERWQARLRRRREEVRARKLAEAATPTAPRENDRSPNDVARMEES